MRFLYVYLRLSLICSRIRIQIHARIYVGIQNVDSNGATNNYIQPWLKSGLTKIALQLVR